ncbi:MAG: hypothetical protein AAF772_14800, partial [Acidobacteriota bacterium]
FEDLNGSRPDWYVPGPLVNGTTILGPGAQGFFDAANDGVRAATGGLIDINDAIDVNVSAFGGSGTRAVDAVADTLRVADDVLAVPFGVLGNVDAGNAMSDAVAGYTDEPLTQLLSSYVGYANNDLFGRGAPWLAAGEALNGQFALSDRALPEGLSDTVESTFGNLANNGTVFGATLAEAALTDGPEHEGANRLLADAQSGEFGPVFEAATNGDLDRSDLSTVAAVNTALRGVRDAAPTLREAVRTFPGSNLVWGVSRALHAVPVAFGAADGLDVVANGNPELDTGQGAALIATDALTSGLQGLANPVLPLTNLGANALADATGNEAFRGYDMNRNAQNANEAIIATTDLLTTGDTGPAQEFVDDALAGDERISPAVQGATIVGEGLRGVGAALTGDVETAAEIHTDLRDRSLVYDVFAEVQQSLFGDPATGETRQEYVQRVNRERQAFQTGQPVSGGSTPIASSEPDPAFVAQQAQFEADWNQTREQIDTLSARIQGGTASFEDRDAFILASRQMNELRTDGVITTQSLADMGLEPSAVSPEQVAQWADDRLAFEQQRAQRDAQVVAALEQIRLDGEAERAQIQAEHERRVQEIDTATLSAQAQTYVGTLTDAAEVVADLLTGDNPNPNLASGIVTNIQQTIGTQHLAELRPYLEQIAPPEVIEVFYP